MGIRKSGRVRGVAAVLAVGLTVAGCGGSKSTSSSAGRWSFQAVAKPPAFLEVLTSVSCASSTECTTVGYRDTNAGYRNLAEGFNSGVWTLESTPDVAAPGGTDRLSSVSCSSASACTAVGSTSEDGTIVAERWNGKSWATQFVPPISAGAMLIGLPNFHEQVVCSSDTRCVATADFFAGPPPVVKAVAVVEDWNGQRWAIRGRSPAEPQGLRGARPIYCIGEPSDACQARFPVPGDASAVTVGPVSCSSSSACTEMGEYSTSPTVAPGIPFAERWNGSVWLYQSVPDPRAAGPHSSLTFTGLSCPSATTCVAVGNESGYRFVHRQAITSAAAVVERWNGKAWTVQTIPAEARHSFLTAVSCASPSACMAVGSIVLVKKQVAFAMRYA